MGQYINNYSILQDSQMKMIPFVESSIIGKYIYENTNMKSRTASQSFCIVIVKICGILL